MMMILCKTFHSLLGFEDRRNPPHRCRRIPAPDGGGLRLLAGDPPSPANVVKSATAAARPTAERTDPGSWGLHAAEDGGLDLCTESLGSESCDVSMGTDEVGSTPRGDQRTGWSWRRSAGRRAEAKKFPPPLPWLAGSSGRRSRFMRAVRADGRIVLTEVQIERPEILRAFREDGRLRLQLVGSSELEQQEEEEAVEAEEEKEVDGRWDPTPPPPSPSPPAVRKNEGLRCQEEVSGNSAALWWNHRCVTTA